MGYLTRSARDRRKPPRAGVRSAPMARAPNSAIASPGRAEELAADARAAGYDLELLVQEYFGELRRRRL
jgi:hypothetical protein